MTNYTIDSSKIAFETFDDQVVLVNLDSGHYFVLEGSAGLIWQLIMAGLSSEEIGRELAKQFDGTVAEMAEAAQAFANELVEGDVLIAVSDAGDSTEPSILPVLESTTKKTRFEPPSLFKYTEMENLIQMDPIREVDETGWPQRRTFPKKGK